MSTAWKEVTMTSMNVVNMIDQGQPFCFHYFTISVFSGKRTPIQMINDTFPPLCNNLTTVFPGYLLKVFLQCYRSMFVKYTK